MEVIDPGTFFGWEVLGGTLGALGGGIGGFLLGFFACLGAVGDHSYAGLGCLGAGALGYLVGTPAGATVGVSVVGGLNGVVGNPWLAFAGGALGEGAGFLSLQLLQEVGPFLPEDLAQPLFFGGIPALSGLGATLGFNVGATLKVSRLSAPAL